MSGLTRLALRSLRERRLRTTLTIIGVALGVAVLFAGLATGDGITAAADRTVQALVGRADLRVAAFGEGGLGSESFAAITATPGVEIVAPALERRTYLEGTNPDGSLPPSVTVLGIDPVAEPRLHDLTLVAGSPLTGADEPSALIDERLAAEDGLELGSTLTVLGAGEPAQYHVIGILAGSGPLGASGGRTVVVPLRTAQAVFDQAGLTRVDIGLAAGASQAEVVAGLESRLLVEPYVISSPQDLADNLRASTADFQSTTALIAAIALFAGAFLIVNTLSMTVLERIRDVGLLRAAGATRGQVQRFILVQAVVVGVLGSLLGLALGAVLAGLMAAWLRTIGSVTLESAAPAASSVVVAFVTGVAVTLAAAIEPAIRASRIPPVEALRARMDQTPARRARLGWLLVVFAVVGIAGLLVWPRDAGAAGAVRALVVYGVLLVATLLVPFLVPALARIGGLPFRLPFALEERLARATIVRDRSRTTLTLGALAVGLALVVALGGVGQHARAAAGAWVGEVVPGELLVTSIRPVAADEPAATDLAEQPGVDRVSPIATFDLAVDGIATDGAAMVGADLAEDGRLTFVQGDRDAALQALDAGGAAIVPASLADRLHLAIDDELTVGTADATTMRLRVVGVAERTLPGKGGEAVLVGWTDATNQLGVAGADAFAITFDPGITPAQLDDFHQAAALSAFEVVTLDQVKGAIDDALVRVFGLFDVLAIVAVIIASLGIANTLTMNVIERVREIGILRAAGMTRRQVWRSVVVEAGVIGVAGSIVGILAGLLVGALMVVLAGGSTAVAFTIPWPTVIGSILLGVALSMLAAAYPAGIASRVSIVRAVAYE